MSTWRGRSTPPAATLALLLPAMNVEDGTEMLIGLKATSPPEVFAGVLDLARAVLAPADDAALAERLVRGVA
jgi:hypothetical protein